MLRKLKAERKVISLIERKRAEEIKEEEEIKERSKRRSRKDRAMSGLRETLNRSYSREASTPRTPKTPRTPRTPRAPTNTPGNGIISNDKSEILVENNVLMISSLGQSYVPLQLQTHWYFRHSS